MTGEIKDEHIVDEYDWDTSDEVIEKMGEPVMPVQVDWLNGKLGWSGLQRRELFALVALYAILQDGEIGEYRSAAVKAQHHADALLDQLDNS